MERSPREHRGGGSGGSGGGGSKRQQQQSRRRSEMVDTDGLWCCIVRRPPPAAIRGGGGGVGDGAEWRRRDRFPSDDGIGSEKGTEILLQSRELEALIKRGISGSAGGGAIVVERTTSKGSPFRLRLSPGRVSPISDTNTAIIPAAPPGSSPRRKLSNPTPPSPPSQHISRASPTLLEMMNLEHESTKQQQQLQFQQLQQQGLILSLPPPSSGPNSASNSVSRPPSVQEKVDAILLLRSPGNCFNDSTSSDVKLTLTSKDGFSVSINVHRHVLTSQSRFFAAKFSDWWSKQHRSPLNAIEISDCDDVDLYLQTIRLMYARDMKRSLVRESVSRVLGILKVSAAILFEAGVISCLEYLEAMPWPEDEEEKVTSLISQLQLDHGVATDVLKRLSNMDAVEPEGIVTRLLQSVIQGTDEKARRETKAIVSKMLRENASRGRDMGESCRECFYRACETCLEALLASFTMVTSSKGDREGKLPGQISRQADNLNWMVDILIDRQIAEGFARMWASQVQLARLYSQTPAVYRYDVSRVTARLCTAIGRGQLLVPQDVRFSLLQTWFQPLVDDFGWLQRCCKSLDKKAVEEGLSQTILTLPLKQQQSILLGWFDCFSRNAGDCPNLNRAFEVWWRRTFVRPLLDATTLPPPGTPQIEN